MEIPFKIIEMKNGGKNRINVKIEYTNPTNDKVEEMVFNLKAEQMLEDAFLGHIKATLDIKFDTSIEVNSKKYLGKTFYHKLKKTSKVI